MNDPVISCENKEHEMCYRYQKTIISKGRPRRPPMKVRVFKQKG